MRLVPLFTIGALTAPVAGCGTTASAPSLAGNKSPAEQSQTGRTYCPQPRAVVQGEPGRGARHNPKTVKGSRIR
jgi:hypothetical protein